jgi:hypothetical protein
MDDLEWKRPALIGGLISGILSVAPFVSVLNVCLCMWAWVGGIVAAKLLIDRSYRIVTAKDGAKIGLYSGLIAGAIVLLIAMPLTLWQMDRILQSMTVMMKTSPEAQSFYLRIQDNPTLKVMFSFIIAFINSVLVLGFTVLGGLVGVALFEKRRNQPPPPQYSPGYPPPYPPNYPPPPAPPAPSAPPASSAPSADNPSHYPPESGGSGGDQGGPPQG